MRYELTDAEIIEIVTELLKDGEVNRSIITKKLGYSTNVMCLNKLTNIMPIYENKKMIGLL